MAAAGPTPRPALVLATALALGLVLAGCLGTDTGSDPAEASDQAPEAAEAAAVQYAGHGAVCSPTRTATVHHAGGEPVEDPAGPVPVPCLSKTGYDSREPTMGVASDGTIFHYPAMTGGHDHPMGVAVSRDGGETWEISIPKEAGQATHPTSLDPYFYLDPRTDRIIADDLTPTAHCSSYSVSTDKAETWTNTVGGCTNSHHQTIFGGPPVSSQPQGTPTVLYQCAIGAGAYTPTETATCEKSLDGGITWIPTGAPAYAPDDGFCPDYGAHGQGFVDAEGTLYLPRGRCEDNQAMIAISEDEGQTWRRVRVGDVTMAEHDAGVAADPQGNIYYFYTDSEDRLPYLTISEDGGETWSEPMMVGAPGVNEASQPEMIVGGTGEVAFVYMGTTNGPGQPFEGSYENTTWNGYIGMTTEALSEDPTFYSAPVNHPEKDALITGQCDSGRCDAVQDFMDVRIGPDGKPYGAFVDGCLPPGDDCLQYEETLEVDSARVGAAGWLADGPSLWGPEDPNGRYPD